MSTDWTNVGGISYVTGPRNQGGSNFCWGFATTALIESMVRIKHGAWCARSEGDLFFGQGMYWFKGGDPATASVFTAAHGLADPDCLPWMQGEGGYTHPSAATADRSGRAVHVAPLEEVSGILAQKAWLDTIGPLTGILEVWSDFGGFYNAAGGVYQKLSSAVNSGGTHIVCIVGYDDGQQCWIAKNSWGANTNRPDAIFRIGFGEVGIDSKAKHGLRWVNPDPWTKRRHRSGGLFVSGNGSSMNNLELIVNLQGRFRQYYKEPAQPWAFVGEFGSHPYVTGILDSGVAAAATTFERNFEIIGRFTPGGSGGPLQHWVFKQDIKAWHPSTPRGFGPPDAVGTPAFIQSNITAPGDFEVVVRNGGGSLSHVRRHLGGSWQNAGLGSWTPVTQFGGGAAFGPAMLQARAGTWPLGEQGRGDIHLIYANNLQHLEHWIFRFAMGNWTKLHEFAAGVTGEAKLVEAMAGGTEWDSGPLDLFVPVNGNVQHFRYQNPNDPLLSWTRLSSFAAGIKSVIGVAQGHRGPWDYDLVLETSNGALEHWVVTKVPAGNWKAALQAKLP